MSILPKLTCIFNTISIKISARVFCRCRQDYSKMFMERQRNFEDMLPVSKTGKCSSILFRCPKDMHALTIVSFRFFPCNCVAIFEAAVIFLTHLIMSKDFHQFQNRRLIFILLIFLLCPFPYIYKTWILKSSMILFLCFFAENLVLFPLMLWDKTGRI